jgi:hypothetical protein
MRRSADHTPLVLDRKRDEYISEELNNHSIDLCEIAGVTANKTQEEPKKIRIYYTALGGERFTKTPGEIE